MLKRAKGKHLAFLDSDDRWSASYLETLIGSCTRIRRLGVPRRRLEETQGLPGTGTSWTG